MTIRAGRQLTLAFGCCLFVFLRILTLNKELFHLLGEYLSFDVSAAFHFIGDNDVPGVSKVFPANGSYLDSRPALESLGPNKNKFITRVSNISGILVGGDGVEIYKTNETTWAPMQDLSSLPNWARKYVKWHRRMREKYPDQELIDNPESPGILIHYCMQDNVGSLCGGLHDRLGKLSRMVAVASLTNRLLLYKWYDPHPLESFLSPNIINWTVPDHQIFERKYFQRQKLPHVTDNYIGAITAETSIVEWMKNSSLANEKILITMHNIQYNPPSEMKVDDQGVFGEIFRAFFRPSDPVQRIMNNTWSSLGIIPGNYTAAHCRVRHPGRFSIDTAVQGKNNTSDPDASGLPFQGATKEMAVKSAIRAIRCSKQLQKSVDEPIYFFSDSEDLVNYVVHKAFPKSGTTDTSDANMLVPLDVDDLTLQALRGVSIVSRDVQSYPTLHIDRQRGYPVEYYYSTFVDLYLAVSARCVTFGVGNFGYFATKISGTRCTQIHEKMQAKRLIKRYNQQTGNAAICRVRD